MSIISGRRIPFHDPNFSLHYGVGAVIGFGETWWVEHGRHDGYWASTKDLGVGLRVPVGIDYAIPRSPVELSSSWRQYSFSRLT